MRLSEEWPKFDPDGEYAEVRRQCAYADYVASRPVGQSLKHLAQEKRPTQLTPLNRVVRCTCAVLGVLAVIGLVWLFCVWFLTLGVKP